MAAGFEAFADTPMNELLVSVTTRLSLILGVVETTEFAGSISVPQFASGTPWFSVVGFLTANVYQPPNISISGNVLSWAPFQGGGPGYARVRVLYGVY